MVVTDGRLPWEKPGRPGDGWQWARKISNEPDEWMPKAPRAMAAPPAPTPKPIHSPGEWRTLTERVNRGDI